MARAFINSLTSEAVDYLNDSENIVVRAVSGRITIVLVLGGLAVAGLVAFLTYDFRWSQAKLVLLACLIFAASYLLISGAWKWFVSRGRSLAPGLIVTRDHAVFVDSEDLEWFPIADLVNADYRHQFNGRTYEFSRLTITYPDAVRKYCVDGMERIESTVEDIEERKRQSLVRANRSERDSVDDVLGIVATTQSRIRLRSLIPTALLTLAFGTVGTLGALQLNEYFHDSLSWQQAAEANTAGSYRQYLRTNAAGRHHDDAVGRLKAFYETAEARYKASLKPDFDQAAVDSILALLRYARETHEYQIKVSFERSADIPPDLIKQLKEEFEVKTVLPLGNTFTEDRMLEREGQLFAVISSSFKQIFPDDVLELVSECASNCSSLNIAYRTSFLDSIYYDVKEKDVPREDRNWSPGILIEWTFSLKIPEEPKSYSFDLESAPADDIFYDTVETVGSDPKEAEQKSFYDAMVTSSFDDFRAHLLFNLGLGADPHPAEDAKSPNAEPSTKVQ